MKSIVSILFRYMLILCLSSILIFGGLTVYFVINDYQKDLADLDQEIFGNVEKSLITDLDRVQNFIEFSRNSAQIQAVKNIKDFITEAYSLSSTLYDKYKNTMTEQDLRDLIKVTLRAMVHSYPDSYIFILNMNGIEELNTDRPEIEQRNVLDLQSDDGRYVAKEIINLAKQQQEGFIDYLWTKPGVNGMSYEKKSYIKLFTPYQWIIGTGAYGDTIKKETQRKVLERLSKINKGKDTYIFAGEYTGVSLLGPAKGKNVLNIEDINGIKIVRELIDLAKSGGGFLTYSLPSISPTNKMHKKLSYCTAVPEWEWYVGSGSDINALKKSLSKSKKYCWKS